MSNAEFYEWLLLYFHAQWWRSLNKKERRRLRKTKAYGVPIGLPLEERPGLY